MKASCDNALDQDSVDIETTFEMVGLMKEAGILTNKSMRKVAQMINKLD